MALLGNFGMCVVLVLYQMSAVYSEDAAEPVKESSLSESSKESDSGEGPRCYCNTAQCVSTGYLCRAARAGGCYSELAAPRRPHLVRYGCLHHLADTEKEARGRCQNSPTQGAPPPRDHSLLLCCFHDLCNHEDSPGARARFNFSNPGGGMGVGAGAAYGSDVWFRAATIAVPVCGALILFLLVVVAVRLLRADALMHADRKLRGGYMSPLAQRDEEDVKKVWVGSGAPLLVAPGPCLVAVARAQLVRGHEPPLAHCYIQR